jgi:hypothetical protein
MSAQNLRERDRLRELLADEASAALESGQGSELAGLLKRHPDVRRDEMLHTATLVQLAFLKAERQPAARMPADLRQRLAARGSQVVRPSAPVTPLKPASRRDPGRTAPTSIRGQPVHYLGWALAAALAVALVVVRPASTPADPAVARAELLAAATDALTLPWAPSEIDGYRNVRGDVVWSQRRQTGFMRLAGLPVNDPARTRYQLWIVDATRDSPPVDGGLFDVSAEGEIIVPIDAKLPIGEPRVFAITAEVPGGVVVSKGPLLVVARS